MAMMHNARTFAHAGALERPEAGARFSWPAGVFAGLSRYLLAKAEERGYRRAIRELQRLDNQTLTDLGITRGEIDHAVRNGRGGL